MPGTFVIMAARLTFRRAHLELPRRNPAQALGNLQPGEFDENAIAILPSAAGPVRGAAVCQRVPSGVDDGDGIHGLLMPHGSDRPASIRGASAHRYQHAGGH